MPTATAWGRYFKILATTRALGIVLDAILVRGILAPALVAALGPTNWWPAGRMTRRTGPIEGAAEPSATAAHGNR